VKRWIGVFVYTFTCLEIATRAKVGMFRDCNKGQGGNDAFVIDGLDGWNKSDRLRDHVGSKCNSFHNTVVKRCDNLLKPGQSIVDALNKQSDITKE
jgi:hypothetical protein